MTVCAMQIPSFDFGLISSFTDAAWSANEPDAKFRGSAKSHRTSRASRAERTCV
jgi:hypothetical protein